MTPAETAKHLSGKGPGPGVRAAEARNMWRVGASMLVVLLAHPAFARGGPDSVRVRGYTTQRGTYVAPHHRTRGDSTRANNWSHVGNANPYTGKRGTKH